MNKEDMLENGLEASDLVDLSSDRKNGQVISPKWFVVPYDIPSGNIATYFPESNVLIPLESVADRSNTPTSKSVPIGIKKSVTQISSAL
jgi:anaerobic selenocysteine-containing dehydrogenase